MVPTPRPRHRRLAALAGCAFLLVPLAAACSSDGDDPTPATTTTAATDGETTTTTEDPEPTPDPDDDGTTTTSEVDQPDPAPVPEGDEQAYVATLTDAFAAEGNTELPLDREQAECVAPRWVDAIGTERFAEAGVTPEDLTVGTDGDDGYFDLIDDLGDAETAEALVGAFAACDIDLTRLVGGLLVDQSGSDPAQVDCFVDAMPAGALEASLSSALDGDDATESSIDDEVEAAARECFR